VTTDPHQYLPVAHAAADLARDLIRTSHPGTITEKTDRDLVSDVDLAVERAVRQHLNQATPGIGFLGEEEGGPNDSGTGWLWTLDPIDGTSNYAHGIPLCAASLALLRDGRPVLGVIDAPFMAERFHAAEGTGAWSHGRRIAASATTQLREAIVAIGDYATGPGAARKNETQLAATISLTPRVHRIRMLGTAALDLAWLAAGRLDASVTFSNHLWDMAAGIILAREAGAAVTDADGTPHTFNSAATIAAAPDLIPQLIPLIQAARISEILGAETAPADSSVSADLDAILSRARYLIFDFDGPVRDRGTDSPAGYIYEALAACRDSGRTPVITAADTPARIINFLTRHGLAELTTNVYTLDALAIPPTEIFGSLGSNPEWVDADQLRTTLTALEASPSECAIITAHGVTIEDASDVGLATIGYTATPRADRLFTEAGADCLLPSLADLTLRLRARPLPN
jgi:myo-inositol-1(or 4)-monophosphatase